MAPYESSVQMRRKEREKRQGAGLESVDLDLLLVDAALSCQKTRDLGTLIALELNDRAQLFILHEGPVACKILLENLEQTLLVQTLWQSLDGRQGLASVTLLDTNICDEK